MRTHTVVDSPVGPLTVVAEGDAVVGLYMDVPARAPSSKILGTSDGRGFTGVVEQLGAYFDGRLTRFDVPLRLGGTPFQQRVWAALQEIPYGETTSYGEIATSLGQPTASRAVGLANGRNPVSIIVPCHRVVGSDGRLTGYGGGLPRKEQLLALERRKALLF